MDFTNINDPAGVKALLDQLRTSQAWQDLTDESETTPTSRSSNTGSQLHILEKSHADFTDSFNSDQEPDTPLSISSHISSLLSQLQPGENGGLSPSTTSSCTSNAKFLQGRNYAGSFQPHDAVLHPSPSAIPTTSGTKNRRSLNFNQALPIIAQLSENAEFMEKLEKLRVEQACVERRLWEERTRIIEVQQEKLQVEQAKASIIGMSLSQNHVNGLQASFREELKKFDRERVLTAWDDLVTKQQAALEALGVPGMFVTTLFVDKEKQQRIVQVLDGLSEPQSDDNES